MHLFLFWITFQFSSWLVSLLLLICWCRRASAISFSLGLHDANEVVHLGKFILFTLDCSLYLYSSTVWFYVTWYSSLSFLIDGHLRILCRLRRFLSLDSLCSFQDNSISSSYQLFFHGFDVLYPNVIYYTRSVYFITSWVSSYFLYPCLITALFLLVV